VERVVHRLPREDVDLRRARPFGTMHQMKRWLGLTLGVALLLMLMSCAPGPNAQQGAAAQGGEVAGFWLGLWHGIIMPITFVISLFSDNVNVYEIHNNGNWYNFGFFLGAGVLLGGGGAGSRGRRI
jgi:hypothetical protein